MNNVLSMDRRHRLLLFFLFFWSGVGALMLEVLWLRQLALLFGNTAQAAAVTLSVFFLGLALGGRLWGKKAPHMSNPLRGYALLELGVAATGPLFLLLRSLYGFIYAPVFGGVAGHPTLIILGKLILAAGILLPPAVLMGGTFPLMGHHLVRRAGELGATGSLLYAVNTIGAATGAFVAGFYLPRIVGLTASASIAVGLLLSVGLTALWLSGGTGHDAFAGPPVMETPDARPSSSRRPLIVALVVASGFGTLGLEVLWTRMFAQVLQNSVYSFAVVLFTFLISLGLGSLLAYGLTKLDIRPMVTLAALLALGGVSVSLAPHFFYWLTDGLAYVAPGADWGRYVAAVFATAGAVTVVPVVLIGAVFPFLLRIEQDRGEQVGRTIGRLISLNAVGAIAGPLVTGFLLIEVIGLWRSISALGYGYLILSAVVLSRVTTRKTIQALPVLAVAVLAWTASLSGLRAVRVEEGERLRAVWEGNSGTVAVVQEGDNLKLKLDNYYTLGDTRSIAVERMQAHLPLLLHPEPRSVFFLGLGTGITAGAALDHPVTSVVAAELVPEVVTAVRRYFSPYTNNLFSDPRVEIVVEDGRNYLLATRETYDVIVGDLFTPWHAGTGSLYTLEHFERVRSRLRDEGLFAQWLPLYQLSEAEFLTIARTMAEVFPEVTLWRGDFSPSRPIVALVGRAEARPLDWATFSSRSRRFFAGASEGDNMVGLFYAGNIAVNRSVLDPYPINTDDRPILEYLAPITQRAHAARGDRRLIGSALVQFFEELLRSTPAETDPFLSGFPPREVAYVEAGLKFFRYHVYVETGQMSRAGVLADQLRSVLPGGPWKAVPELGVAR